MASVSENSFELAERIANALTAVMRFQYLSGKYVSGNPHITEEEYRNAATESSEATLLLWKTFYSTMSDYRELSDSYDSVCATLEDLKNPPV